MQRRSSRLFSPRRKRKTGCLMVVLLFFAALILVLALNGLSNRYVRLGTRKVTITTLPRALEGFTILHLSDLNAAILGKDQENLKEALGKEAYDVVVMSGDMVGKSGNAQPLMDVLDVIGTKAPVFIIAGDSDPSPLLDSPHGDGFVKADYIRQAEEKGAIYLETPYKLVVNEQTLWLCPADTFLVDLPAAQLSLNEQITLLESSENQYEPRIGAQLRHARHRLEVLDQTLQSLLEMQAEDLIVAVSHHPPDSEQLGDLSISARENNQVMPALFLAGQFNNGQTRIPGLGTLYIPKQIDGRGGFLPGDEGFTGLSITKGFPVYISPGLGVSSYYPLPLRLFNRPSVTLLSLTAKMTR